MNSTVDAADFLGMLKDPKGYGIKKAVAALQAEHIQITEIDLSFEFDEFRQLDVWTVDITGTNVEMFQGMKLHEQLASHVDEYTDCWILSSRSPRYISNLNDGTRDGYCSQEFSVTEKPK